MSSGDEYIIKEKHIQEMTEETDLDEEVFKSKLEKRRVDEFYEDNLDVNKNSKSNRLLTTIRFIGYSFIRNPCLPIFATVSNIKQESEYIELTLESQMYDTQSSEITNRTVCAKYTESQMEDIEFIMEKVGVNNPSDLLGEKIPVFPATDVNEGQTIPIYAPPKKPKSISKKLSYYKKRFLMRTKSVEQMESGENPHTYRRNRNFYLLFSLPFTPLLYGKDILFTMSGESLAVALLIAITLLISFVCTIGYLLAVIYSLGIGLGEYLFVDKDKRGFVTRFINK